MTALQHVPSAQPHGDGQGLSKVFSVDGAPSGSRLLAPDWRRVWGLREMGVYYSLVFLIVVLSIAAAYTGRDNYLSLQNLANVLQQSSLTAIMAVAMTVILI